MKWFACMVVLFAAASRAAEPVREHTLESAVDIAPVWAGHPVGFALLTHGENQFVAFYDAERRMTIGSRKTSSKEWTFQRLPSQLGWDSHNSIAMTVDSAGHLHVSGNMHCVPLVYFRTTRPLDTASFERVPKMVGDREARCTYPRFLTGPAGQLLFTYRDGSSGNGDQIFNEYNVQARTWRRLLDKPLTSGEGKMNAYFNGPVRGPDGFFHLCWVWRDTPDCNTNHDLSYARSRDLVHWETSQGKPPALPITLAAAEVVDPVPAGGGMINGNTRVGFDARGRVILSYHKYDPAGKTQIYHARLEDGAWKIRQATDWTYRWEFGGGGTIVFDVHVSPVKAGPGGQLTQGYSNRQHGSGTWIIDEATLRPAGQIRMQSPFPPEKGMDFPGLQWRTTYDSGSPPANLHYALRWQTLPSNRDRPREGPLPPASMLRLYTIRCGDPDRCLLK